MNGNLRAIYLTNGGGSGGETLSTLKSDSGKNLISTGDEDKVQSLFSFCVGEGGENGCKNAQGGSVVLVGSDLNTTVTWEKLKSENWGQTSLVRSGHSYDGLFKKRFWSGWNNRSGSKLQGLVLQGILRKPNLNRFMAQIMCPWSQRMGHTQYQSLRAHCKEKWGARLKTGRETLFDFLNDDSAGEYFKPSNWTGYGKGWEGVAFLVLMKLWSADLTHVNYGGSNNIFDHKSDGFSLRSLIRPSSDVIFASLDSENEKITSIDKYSSNKWTVLLNGRSGDRETNQSLSVTLSSGELCIKDLVCLKDSELNRHGRAIKGRLKAIDPGNFGSLWSLIFGKTGGQWNYKIAFMTLLAAAFNSPEDVVVSVQEPSERGEMIFKLMEEKK